MNKRANSLALRHQIETTLYQIDALGILLSQLVDLSLEEGSREAFAIEQCGKLISEKAIEVMEWMDQAI